MSTDLTVFYRLDGTATGGSDYEAMSGSVIIHCGVNQAYVMIRPLDDLTAEPSETVVLSLLTNAAYARSTATASVMIHDNDNRAPTATMTAPVGGSSFMSPVNVALEATAADADGSVSRVEFYANNVLVGSDSNAPFGVTWMNPFPGEYTVYARAVDNFGAYGNSPSIVVKIQSVMPVFTVSIPDSSASEPGTNTACFSINRTGDTSAAVTVYYKMTGVASNGVDYEQLSGSVTFAAGARYATVLVRPIDDTLKEPTEAVALSLLSNTAYLVGSPLSATASIADNDNTPPTVAVISPANGSTFESPGQLLVQAEAADSDGSVQRVEFWFNNVLFATDTNAPYSVTWMNPPNGTNRITAKAFDNLGAYAYSAVTTIRVQCVTGKPVLTIQTLDSGAAEPGTDTALFQITRDGDTNVSLVVSYGVEGTAQNGIDYENLPGSLSMPAGMRVAFLQVRPLDDTLLEGTESVLVRLRTNSAYVVGCLAAGYAHIRDNESCSNARPTVVITAPQSGSIFTATTNVVIAATASDPDGEILRVEFWANNLAIGAATAAPYRVTWINPRPGAYRLIARAVDNRGTAGYSQPVEVTVRSPIQCPMVGIKTLDGYAAEPGTNTALFQVVRSCATSAALTVAYRIEGTAVNGVDYQQLPGYVTIPAGARAANIVVRPIDDNLVEQVESVRIILLPYSSANIGYTICATSAVACIADNDIATNIPPSVAVVSPTNGESFRLPTNILITASAADGDGSIASVEIFADGVSLGVLPAAPYSVLWTNATEGYHDLAAAATDNKGASSLSQPVTIQVLSAPLPVLATRQLPNVYVPGVKHPVKISVDPLPGTASYTIEDTPPSGWAVVDVNDGGTYDPVANLVTFTITGDAHQELHYKIQAPDTDSGEKCFSGIMRVGSSIGVIGGDECISTPPAMSADSETASGGTVLASLPVVVTDVSTTIPAEENPAADFVITKAEVDAYELAWRGTSKARIAPNPVPVSFLTRAAYIWANGGEYVFADEEDPPFAPMIWVPSDHHAHADAWSASGEGHGAAFCFMPTNHAPGSAFDVSIVVTPASQTVAWAVQERAPAGWTISNISDGGSYCPLTGTIKWGLFYGDLPRTLTFTVTPGEAPVRCAHFNGVASFDGVNVPVGGGRCTDNESAPEDHEQAQPDHNPRESLFNFFGEPGTRCRIEATSNLNDWHRLDALLNNDGILQYMDPEMSRLGIRIYRVIPLDDSAETH